MVGVAAMEEIGPKTEVWDNQTPTPPPQLIWRLRASHAVPAVLPCLIPASGQELPLVGEPAQAVLTEPSPPLETRLSTPCPIPKQS